MNINVCFSPVLYPYYVDSDDTIVVVVDVFRATTTMCVALSNGASSIMPVATVEEAKDYKSKGYLVGGERNVVKFEFGDFGNSPSEYTPDKVKGKDIVISTTNGTHAIDMADNSSCLVIGAFSNLSTVADFCLSQKKNVLVLCAGWQDKFNLEDTLFGGALIEMLVEKGDYNANFDAANVALSMWKEAKKDMSKYISKGEHMKRLEAHNLLDVATFCLEPDTTKVLPIYDKGTKKITVKNI